MVENEILISTEPEFESCNNPNLPASFFVVCKRGENLIGGLEAYKHLIAGERICDWVARACDNAQIIEINDYQNEIDAVKPFLTTSDYTVILNSNIPLLNKQHLRDIVQFVMLKNMNACKLKGGYIFKTEYLQEFEEIASAYSYNLPTNDFFAVTNLEYLNFARKEIEKRMFNYFSKNGVTFKNIDSCVVDANVQIASDCDISFGCQILKSSKILRFGNIGSRCIISNSQIAENAQLFDNVVIKDSTIGKNIKIGNNVYIENSTIGDNCIIESGARIVNSIIETGTKISKLCDIMNSHINKNAQVGAMARLFNAEIEEDYDVFDGKVIIHRVEEKK